MVDFMVFGYHKVVKWPVAEWNKTTSWVNFDSYGIVDFIMKIFHIM